MSTSINTIMGLNQGQSPTSSQVKSAIDVIAATAEAIRLEGEIPAGHLYAHLMGSVTLEGFEKVIGILVRAELVEKRGDLLVWVGPEISK